MKSQVPQDVVPRTAEQQQVQYYYGGQVLPQAAAAPHVQYRQCMYIHCIDASTVYVITYLEAKISCINCHFSIATLYTNLKYFQGPL